jgi:XTP/dITP diphosphohydrolase
MKLLVASTNPGKIHEIQAVLSPLALQLVLPEEIGIYLRVEETGTTYAENATLKARAFCLQSGLVSLADDSGLQVQALDGAPGLHSARFSPIPGAQDADRRAYLLEKLQNEPYSTRIQGWQSYFHCTVAIATPQGQVYLSEGRCDGWIINQERGINGFGYDPLFYLPQYERTMAELPAQIKNQISHRARALQAARPTLEKLITAGGD